ncbi:hypothetical protein E3N88_42455 [Mikania micrantha]|uniref:CCHC-type domain-containing protein n=1 Tax=Mikania micrantha TaxID=192012 RepID=A0A5N6LJZ5_9ASTR|nr:hypothetical protein E3N88_42455 [Mikania micrantha]
MPPRRRVRRNADGAGDADAELVARINQTFNNLLPTIIESVRNPNPNPNVNADPNANPNPIPVAGNNVGANQNVGIHVWLERFQKQKPRSFIKAATPVEAKDWISHIEKIFRVLGVENQYKSRLAAYKLEEDAQNWWESILLEKGGQQFAETLPWDEFCALFFEKYFSNVDISAYKREYHNIRQRNDEPLDDFIDRFYRLIGFLGSTVGSPLEHAEKFQWAVCDRIRRAIIHSHFNTVAEAAKKIEMERKEFLSGSDDSRKRNRDGNRIQSSGQSSSQGNTADNNRAQGNQVKPWKGKNQNQGQAKQYKQPVQAQPGNQFAQHPLYNYCNKHHPGVCRRLTGACLRCGEMGHMIKQCPKMKNKPNDNANGANVKPNTRGRVFALITGDAANATDSLHQSLCFFGSSCPIEHWMKIPEAGAIIANKFGAIVHLLSKSDITTISVLCKDPNDSQYHKALTIALVNDENHYVMVELQEEYLMPVITPY